MGDHKVSDAAILQRMQREAMQRRRTRIPVDARLTKVNAVRYARWFEGKTIRETAEQFNLHYRTVQDIARGVLYQSVPFDDRMRAAVAQRMAGPDGAV